MQMQKTAFRSSSGDARCKLPCMGREVPGMEEKISCLFTRVL